MASGGKVSVFDAPSEKLHVSLLLLAALEDLLAHLFILFATHESENMSGSGCDTLCLLLVLKPGAVTT